MLSVADDDEDDYDKHDAEDLSALLNDVMWFRFHCCMLFLAILLS